MLQESFRTAEDDMAARSLREAQVDAERMLLATRVGAGCRRRSACRRGARRDRRAGGDARRGPPRATTASRSTPRVKALAEGTEAFAAERMNRGIRRALAGRRVEDV